MDIASFIKNNLTDVINNINSSHDELIERTYNREPFEDIMTEEEIEENKFVYFIACLGLYQLIKYKLVHKMFYCGFWIVLHN